MDWSEPGLTGRFIRTGVPTEMMRGLPHARKPFKLHAQDKYHQSCCNRPTTDLAMNSGHHIRAEISVGSRGPLPIGITLNLVDIRHWNLRWDAHKVKVETTLVKGQTPALVWMEYVANTPCTASMSRLRLVNKLCWRNCLTFCLVNQDPSPRPRRNDERSNLTVPVR